MIRSNLKPLTFSFFNRYAMKIVNILNIIENILYLWDNGIKWVLYYLSTCRLRIVVTRQQIFQIIFSSYIIVCVIMGNPFYKRFTQRINYF